MKLLTVFFFVSFLFWAPPAHAIEVSPEEFIATWSYLKKLSAGDKPVQDALRDIGSLANIAAQVAKGVLGKPTAPEGYANVDPKCQAKEKYYYRTHDGTCNWLKTGEADLGKVGAPFGRDVEPGHFGKDGVNDPREGPNARELSNAFFNNDIQKTRYWSHTSWLIGYVEFLVHDLILSNSGHGPGDKYDIPVPKGDPHFDPEGTGTKKMPFWRTKKVPGTGVPGTPRSSQNDQSIWMDMATIYGNNAEVNAKLRTFEDGKLILDYSKDPDGLLPLNDERFGLPQIFWRDPKDTFAAGDIRANQDLIIQTFHTLFAREHNRMCELLKGRLPNRDWTDEELFLAAKTLVGTKFSMVGAAYFQSYFTDMPFPSTPMEIYSQYMGTGPTSPIQPYPWPAMLNPKTGHPDPLPEEFSVGYRWHDLISPILNDTDNNEEIDVVKTAWSAKEFIKYGFDRIVRAMSHTSIPDFHSGISNSLRNLKFSFRDPEEGDLFDIAAWAIEHERERGCPTFNEWAKWYPGKVPIPIRKTWADFTNNTEHQKKLAELYKTPDDVDMWVGQQLDESWWPHTHIPTAFLGISFYTLFKGSVADRFALLYQLAHCLIEQKPWNCEHYNIIQEVLWTEVEFLGQKLKWLDLTWLNEFDAPGQGNNMLRQIIAQNSRNPALKCLQKNVFFLPNDESNPITCWGLKDVPENKYGTISVLPKIGKMEPYLEMAEKYGDIVHYTIGPLEFLLLSRINDLKNIFENPAWDAHQSIPHMDSSYGRLAGYKNGKTGYGISNDRGWSWEKKRWIFDTKIAPNFHQQLPLINHYGRALVETFKTNANKKYKPFWDIHWNYNGLTGTLAFSEAWVSDPKVAKTLYEGFIDWEEGFPMDWNPVKLNWYMDYTNKWMKELIAKKRQSGNYGSDWFGIFASTPAQDGTKLSDEDVFVSTYDAFAGNVGGPFQLTYGLWLLGKFPGVQAKLYAEIKNVVGTGTEISRDQYDRMVYLRHTVKEMLRYFPGGGFYGGGRINPNTTEVVETYLIPPNVTIITNTWKIQHDKRYFTDPEAFNPDRWVNFPDKHAYAFQTFGAGRRGCAGKSLVEYQVAINVAHVVKNYKIGISDTKFPEVEMTVYSKFSNDKGPEFTFTPRVAGDKEDL